MQSVLAGQTPVFHNALPRPLTVAASKRTPYFPDVPTIAEAGYPGHEVGFWMGVFVPAGTPKDLVDILNKQVARIMALSQRANGDDRVRSDREYLGRTDRPHESGNRQMVEGGPPSQHPDRLIAIPAVR